MEFLGHRAEGAEGAFPRQGTACSCLFLLCSREQDVLTKQDHSENRPAWEQRLLPLTGTNPTAPPILASAKGATSVIEIHGHS